MNNNDGYSTSFQTGWIIKRLSIDQIMMLLDIKRLGHPKWKGIVKIRGELFL